MTYKYSYLLGKSYKIDKSDEYSDYENFIMYLAPYDLSGTNICPFASKGCAESCLNTAGRGAFNATQKARLNRTLHYLNDRKGFFERLTKEIFRISKKYDKVAIRLNGTSDLNFNSFIRKIEKVVPNVIFYDYTKNPLQALKSLSMDNYHVTFSRSEDNNLETLDMLDSGINVAAVFRKELPKEWNGFEVIDGDVSDTRFLDSAGKIIGLRAKGKAKKDLTGFVIN